MGNQKTQEIGTQTLASGQTQVTLTAGTSTSLLALLVAEAATINEATNLVRIEMPNGVSGTVFYNTGAAATVNNDFFTSGLSEPMSPIHAAEFFLFSTPEIDLNIIQEQ